MSYREIIVVCSNIRTKPILLFWNYKLANVISHNLNVILQMKVAALENIFSQIFHNSATEYISI
jgi:hypothetical protein